MRDEIKNETTVDFFLRPVNEHEIAQTTFRKLRKKMRLSNFRGWGFMARAKWLLTQA